MRPSDTRHARATAAMVVLVALLAALAAAAGAPGPATYGARVSGDEPHYLLTALSLAEDGGLDVSDEVAEERYRPFHEVDLARQAQRRPDGSAVVPHDPLLPLLLAPAVSAGGWLGAKLALAGLAGMLSGLLCWTAIRRLGTPLAAAGVVTGVFATSAPLAVYGHQIYPELPAALAVAVAATALLGPFRRGGIALLAIAVATLPWLAVKYTPVAAVLAVIALVRLWRRPPYGRSTALLVLVGAFVLAGALYVAAHLAWYGGLTVYAAGDFFQEHGGQLTVVGVDPSYLGRARRLLGLLVGRNFGLAAWQPAWLLLVPAIFTLLRRRPDGWHVLALPLAAGWLVATFVALTMQGWWFPGRQIVVVLPLAVLTIAWWVGRARTWWPLAVTSGLGLLGVSSYIWLAVGTATGEVTWIVDFFRTNDPWYRIWRLALPDYLDVTAMTWLRHAVWLVIVGLTAVGAWRSAATRGRRTGPAR